MKLKILLLVLIGAILFLSVSGVAAAAQEGDLLQLGLVRNFGYGGLGKIQGSFTLKIADPPDGLEEVAFYLDGSLLGRAATAPFQVKFSTSDFPPGEHAFRAQGRLADGRELGSNSLTKTFLSSEDAWSETQNILAPLLIGVGALTLLGLGVPMLASRKKDFYPGVYGPAGGAVCPRCGLPFSRPALAPNLMVGKLVRCPHCGKISILARASRTSLDEAERRYAGSENTAALHSEDGDLKKMLDESRFEE